MLVDRRFKNWTFEKSFDDDPEVPIIHYVFPHNALELRCDLDDQISVIFLRSEHLLDVPFSFTRERIADRFGSPSRSGGGIIDPILGEHGAWDRFDRPGYQSISSTK